MNKMKILILHFPSLNNYGTAMMGLVTIQAFADRFGVENIEFFCDFLNHTDIEEIKKELNGDIVLNRYIDERRIKIADTKNLLKRKIKSILYYPGKGFDAMIVLGGDDFSEYYAHSFVAREIFDHWKASFRVKVIFLGQTLGPFSHPLNCLAVKYLLPRLNIYARDPLCVEYLREKFGLKINLMADLALMNLPNQNEKSIEVEILKRYNLTTDNYFTMVISGLIKSYCNSEYVYLEKHKNILVDVANRKELVNKKIVLLAHTLPPYQDEVSLINKLVVMLPEEIKARTVLVKDRILPTRARLILGNGLFTITGRMHAAVSTFQMGKPAICLSYSAKYKGVIGESIGQPDLVIEAGDSIKWENGEIVDEVIEKTVLMLKNYQDRKAQIIERTLTLKRNMEETMKDLGV